MLSYNDHAIKYCFLMVMMFMVTLPLIAQPDVITATTDYIAQNNYKQADRYLDSVLAKSPSNVDALMMKGNVLLNYAWQNTSQSYFNLERAESIFDSSAISQAFFIPIIPRDTSILIERYWQKCLQLNNTRTDIKKGICNLYSISLRTEDLILQLYEMKPALIVNEENAYAYAEYARNIKARGKFDEAIRVYQYIADMFPRSAGIRCDMAGEYFYAGKLNDALRYLDSTLSKKEVDATSYINTAAIYSVLGYYDNAYKVFVRYSAQESLLAGNFYKGLMLFAEMDSNWQQQLYSFNIKANEQNYNDEAYLARKLLSLKGGNFTLSDYRDLVADDGIPDYYKVLIHQRAIRQFKTECEPFIMYGALQCIKKNYSATAQLLSQEEDCDITDELIEQQRLLGGYTLYMLGKKDNSLLVLSRLYNSEDAFKKQAAQYFSAKIKMETGQKEEAKTLFQSILASGEKTKYQWLAGHYLGKL